MAALGDSISRGSNSCGQWQDCLGVSWTTGDNATVDSHYRRILARNSGISGNAHNYARSGARVADLDGQARTAVSQQVEYVTIMVGANDACTPTEAAMTPVATFESQFRTAMSTLTSGLPNASVYVVSIPDIKRLWAVGKDSGAARLVWGLGRVCQSLLAKPTSASAADNARRDRVRQRIAEYNGALARVCAEHTNCRDDGGAVFAQSFSISQISRLDYFHPNAAGQAVLADVSYRAGYGW